jgi:hypothetical protein
MAEPNPPREHAGELHRPVPLEAPMPAKAGRNLGVAVLAILGCIVLLLLFVLEGAGAMDGARRALYAIPAVLFGAAAAVALREAKVSGRR